VNKIVSFIKNIFKIKCNKCDDGYINYIGTDVVDIYECDNCREEFI